MKLMWRQQKTGSVAPAQMSGHRLPNALARV
jgi:hypothetical protein